MLDGGSIVYLYYFNKHGIEALDMMSDITEARFLFQSGVTSSKQSILPPTEVILQTLEHIAQASASITEVPLKAVDHQLLSNKLTPSRKQYLEDILTEYIGPAANFICEDVFSETDDIAKAIHLMVQEIEDNQDVIAFQKAANQL